MNTNDLDSCVDAYKGDIKYDFDNNILLNWYPKRIISQTCPSSSLLELGLGHGYSTNLFSQFYSHHNVLDGSKLVIENFKNKYPNCRAIIEQTYFEEYESKKNFDLIIMGFILEHVESPNFILEYYRKFLKANGRLFISVPNAEVLNRRLGLLTGMLPDIKMMSENDYLLGHKRYYTVNSLKQEIEKASYEIIKMEGIYLKPFTTSQILSLNLPEEVINALCEVGINYPELSCGILAEVKPK
jgi:2-polyprenyl-3-methyl-5-hydroxy-6-metoxy-1,4-benzoquinol methylase